MSIYYRTKGFVLSKYNAREADQVFDIYTKDFGKLKISGKGIRKIKSKLKPGMELFCLSKVEFIQGKTFKTLTDAAVIEKFKNIKKDLNKLKIAYQIAELTDSLVSGQEKDEAIFNLLTEIFNKLNTYQPISLPAYQLIYYYFLWNLFSILGYQIDLYNCSVCQNKLLPEKLYFILEKGGITCSKCFKGEGKEIFPEVIKILRIFGKRDWSTLLRLKISEPYKKSLESISESYLFYFEQNQ